MFVALIVVLLALFGVVGFLAARTRVIALSGTRAARLKSRPIHYASFVAFYTVVPALAVMIIWLVLSPIVMGVQVREGFSGALDNQPPAATSLSYNSVLSVARGLRLVEAEKADTSAGDGEQLRTSFAQVGVQLAQVPRKEVILAAKHLNKLRTISNVSMAVVVAATALGGFVLSLRNIRPEFRARRRVERVVYLFLIAASSVAVLTTLGIVLSLIVESLRFFSLVSPKAFFFGAIWDPGFSSAGEAGVAGQFGLIPLLVGTLYIAAVALVFAVPVGLFAAIYLAEYAGARFRAIAKPALEVLAGIPAIVYGVFALVIVGPFLRDLSGVINGIVTGDNAGLVAAQSVLTAGLVIGAMLIPYISSLADDIIKAVPASLKEGSLSLGATQSETIRHVLLPAAKPGIAGALLLTASRAIGETVIVVLAAGLAAQIHYNPFEPMTTVTVQIVNQLIGSPAFDTPQTLVAFALGLTLFVITLVLNIYALYIVRGYKELYA